MSKNVPQLMREKLHGSRAGIRGFIGSHPFAFCVFLGLLLYALIVPMFWDAGDPSFANALISPGNQHWFGTDHFGYDLFVRTAESLRVSLTIGAISAALATGLGVGVGLLAAALGGIADRVIMRVNDAVNAIPHLILTVVVVALFRGSLVAIVASIALTHWSPVARIVRASVLAVRTSEMVECSYGAGASFSWVLRKHLAPAAGGQALVAMAMLMPHAVWHESALSFLGLGIQANEPSLGTLMDLAREDITRGAWWTLVFPACVLLATTLSGVFLARKPSGWSRRTAAHSSVEKESFRELAAQSPEAQSVSAAGRGGFGNGDSRSDVVELKPGACLGLRNWSVAIDGQYIVRDINVCLHRGELHALIGTSGSGKTTVGHGFVGVAPLGSEVSGSVVGLSTADGFDGEVPWRSAVFESLRGREVGFVPQDAARSLTPVRRVGTQLQELIDQHAGASSSSVAELLARVQLEPEVAEMFPHQLSGGMAQRVAVAAALAGNPSYIIADEPTSALDPELTRDVLLLLHRLAGEQEVGVLLISHDLEDLRQLKVCDRVAVMNEGRCVEEGPGAQVLGNPQAPFTARLLEALPSGGLRWEEEYRAEEEN